LWVSTAIIGEKYKKMKKRYYCIVILFYLLGCSDTQNTQAKPNTKVQTSTSITLKNLVYVDVSSLTSPHKPPFLMVGPGYAKQIA
jgi:uncharacterized protein YcfL